MAAAKTEGLIKLTRIEKLYFDRLKEEEGNAVDRSYFIHLHEDYPQSNVVDVHMKNLRRKVAGVWDITAVRGAGYSMQKV